MLVKLTHATLGGPVIVNTAELCYSYYSETNKATLIAMKDKQVIPVIEQPSQILAIIEQKETNNVKEKDCGD